MQAKQIAFDPERTLFLLADGLNDRLPGAETIGNLKAHISEAVRPWVRRFRIALLPEAIAAFTEVGVRLNPEVSGIPEAIRAQLPGVEIALNNWGPHFDEAMRNPAANGIRNTKDKCAGRALFDEDATPCSAPATYFYYHACILRRQCIG